MLYDHFNKSLWEKIKQQGEGFFDEVEDFRAKVAQIQTVCFKELNESISKKVFEAPLLMRNSIPKEMRDLCSKLKRRDKEYVQVLKDKQKELVNQINLDVISRSYYQDVNDNRIYYEFRNRTNFNVTRNPI